MRTSYFPFTEPSVEFDVTCFLCNGQGCARVQALGLDRDGRRGLGRSRCVPQRRLRPRRLVRLRVRARHRAHRDAAPRPRPTCACSGRTTSACWSSSDEGPRLAGCASTSSSTCRSRSSRGGSSSRAARSTASCAAASPDEDGNLELFLVGKVLEAEKHPNADRLQLTQRRRRRGRAALDRLRRVELRRRRDGRRRAAGRGAPERPDARARARCAARSRTG